MILELFFLWLLAGMMGSASVLLLEKWKVDDYMNTHPYWSKYWPTYPCVLCRGFWFGFFWFAVALFVPYAKYVLIPFAAIPVQVLFVNLLIRKI